jgi:hypothetical protein
MSSFLPLPIIALEVCITEEFVAQSLCMDWHEACCCNTLWTIEFSYQRLHPLAGTNDKPWLCDNTAVHIERLRCHVIKAPES